jgi:hypothetical protein
VFNLGKQSKSAQAISELPLELKLVVNMDLGTVQFWKAELFLTEERGLRGTVYPTLMLMGRGKILHATIVKAIKSSS